MSANNWEKIAACYVSTVLLQYKIIIFVSLSIFTCAQEVHEDAAAGSFVLEINL